MSADRSGLANFVATLLSSTEDSVVASSCSLGVPTEEFQGS